MTHLFIKHVGPIQEANLNMKKVTVFIGPQSSGKSTIAKVFSFCSWLDKMTESVHHVCATSAIANLIEYHHMSNYLHPDSQIFYQGDNIIYSYQCDEKIPHDIDKHYHHVASGDGREKLWEFNSRQNSPKVAYLPAERNFVTVVPNLSKYLEDDDGLQHFVNEWYAIRRRYSKANPLEVLSLGAKYYHDEVNQVDHLIFGKDTDISIDSASSGMQSVTPIVVMVDWLTKTMYSKQGDAPFSPQEIERLVDMMQAKIDKKDAVYEQMVERVVRFIKGKVYTHTQLIIEEPEQNLYPDTQCHLLNYLLTAINHGKNHRLLLTTHSPYILNYLNVLLLRSQNSAVYLNGDSLNVYRLYEGKTYEILGTDKFGNKVIDTSDLSETMEQIYNEYVVLNKQRS